jgi:hypothetical protein
MKKKLTNEAKDQLFKRYLAITEQVNKVQTDVEKMRLAMALIPDFLAQICEESFEAGSNAKEKEMLRLMN